MNNRSKGIIVFMLLGTIVVLSIYFGTTWLDGIKRTKSSDSGGATRTVHWAGDSYAGYAFIKSTEMRKRLARKGIVLDFTDDGGAYADRLKKLNDSEYDFIVLPISSYIEHGYKYKYPGVISGAISESRGADAILVFKDFPFLKVNDLNDSEIKIVVTPDSPSEDLVNLTITNFDLDELQGRQDWMIEASGSEAVYKQAKADQNDPAKGQRIYTMWEPDVSNAIDNLGMKKIWGSDNFRNYIVDVFVFNRKYVNNKEEEVREILRTYFEVVDYYMARKEEMFDELRSVTGAKRTMVPSFIDNIKWYDLQENAHLMFGIQAVSDAGSYADEGLVKTIYAWNDVNRLMKKDIEVDNPYEILNRTFIEGLASTAVAPVGKKSDNVRDFEALSKDQWEKLQESGTMRVENITFKSGIGRLDNDGEETVDNVAQKLIHNYPNYRVLVAGHTGYGDAEANLKLSQERADIVRQQLIAVYNIDEDRILAKGFGAERLPKRKNGESERAYRLRMQRVEFILLQ
ncbi:MAG: phosphate ABC transporter substrate-binding/OmpA family protein [Bacteroidales bacterium]